MRVDILKRLLRAHIDRDDAAFRKAALQLAASEGEAGHVRIARELRDVVAEIPLDAEPTTKTIDIGAPRGEVADLLEGGYREERLRDIVLKPHQGEQLERVLRENRRRVELERWGVTASRRLLFYGPPGCGKSLGASVIAGELGLPLLTVRFDGLFSRFLGATARHLKVIFDEMPRRPAVYLFDEFDAIAKQRSDQQEVGEIRRVVTSFLQLLDRDQSRSVIIAATNHEGLLDQAVFRRFDEVVLFDRPAQPERERLVRLRLSSHGFSAHDTRIVAEAGSEMSYADIARACNHAIKAMVLDGRKRLSRKDVVSAIEIAKIRPGTPDPTA